MSLSTHLVLTRRNLSALLLISLCLCWYSMYPPQWLTTSTDPVSSQETATGAGLWSNTLSILGLQTPPPKMALNQTFLNCPSEGLDSDNDGVPNTADFDDDNDGIPDSQELQGGDASCFQGFYQVISGQLKVLDVTSGEYLDIGPHPGFTYNAMAFNPGDGKLYAIATSSGTDIEGNPIVRGDIITINPLDGIVSFEKTTPLSGSKSAITADIYDGIYYFTNAGNLGVYQYDLSTKEVSKMTNVQDWSTADWIIKDGIAYGMHPYSQGARLYKMDLTADYGIKTSYDIPYDTQFNLAFGAAYISEDDLLFFSSNDGGLYQVFDYDTENPYMEYVIPTIPTNNNDGASCSGSSFGQTDSDNDGTPDYLDTDSDNDGIPDACELCGEYDLALENGRLDDNGDAVYKQDGDCSTGVVGSACTGTPKDTDGDGTPDFLDTDSDNDGLPDSPLSAKIEANGNLDDEGVYFGFPDNALASPAGNISYKLCMDNYFPETVSNLVMVGVLPSVEDKNIKDGSENRWSLWKPDFTTTTLEDLEAYVASIPGATLYYSTECEPCLANDLGTTITEPADCASPDWSTEPPVFLDEVCAFKIDYGSSFTLAQDEGTCLTMTLQAPFNVPTDGSVAWNSFGYVGETPNGAFGAAEATKVGVAGLPFDADGDASSGARGGLESNNRLANKLAYRNYVQTVRPTELYQQKLEGDIPFEAREFVARSGEIELSALIPTDLWGAFVAESSPSDLINLTNATEMKSADYYIEGIRRAVVMAMKSENGAYEHSKYICDRLDGSRLLDISYLQVDMGRFIMYKLERSNGQIEYAVSFSASLNGDGSASIENHWNLHKYSAGQDYYNIQLWSASYDRTQRLLSEVLRRLDAQAPIQEVNTTEFPELFITSGEYKNGSLELTIFNRPRASQMVLKGNLRQSESGEVEPYEEVIPLTGEKYQTVTVSPGNLYDIGFSILRENGAADELFFADGTWGYDDRGSEAEVELFEVSPETYAEVANTYKVARAIQVKSEVKDYLNIYRSFTPKWDPIELTGYNTLNLTASGQGRVQVTILKTSIQDWGQQLRTEIVLEGNDQMYALDLRNFDNYQPGMELDDVNLMIFTLVGDGQNFVQKEVSIQNVYFGQNSAPIAELTEENFLSVYPNPARGEVFLKMGYTHNTTGILSLMDMQGRRLKVWEVPVRKDPMARRIDISGLPSGIYVVSLTLDRVNYLEKIVVE